MKEYMYVIRSNEFGDKAVLGVASTEDKAVLVSNNNVKGYYKSFEIDDFQILHAARKKHPTKEEIMKKFDRFQAWAKGEVDTL